MKRLLMLAWRYFPVTAALLFAMTFVGSVLATRAECLARWEASGMRSRYQLVGGCLVEKSPGRWVPDDSLRELP